MTIPAIKDLPSWSGSVARAQPAQLESRRDPRSGSMDHDPNEKEWDGIGDAVTASPKAGDSEAQGGCLPVVAAGQAVMPARLSKARNVMLAVIMLFTFFLGAASTSSVMMLVPPIARTLRESELQAQWVASAYTLAYGCGLLFAGRIADIFGRRTLYLAGLSLSAAACLPIALVRNLIALCICRALSGVGLAIACSAGYGIIGTNIIHEPARTVTFATFGLGNPIGAGMGTIIGGAIAGRAGDGWANHFYLLMGLAFGLAVVAFFYVPKDTKRAMDADTRVDWFGGLLVTSAIALFTFSITSSGKTSDGWRTPYVSALLATSVILMAVFIYWSLRLESRGDMAPIIKLSIFSRHHHRVSYICASAFFTFMCTASFLFATSLYYQKNQGLDPLGNALYILPCNIVGVLAAASVMFLAPRVAAPKMLLPATIAMSITPLLFAVKPEGLSYWKMEFPALLFLPWGPDYIMGLGNIFMSNLLLQGEQAAGGGMFLMAGQTGNALGTCVSALLANNQPGLVGLRHAFWFSFAAGVMVVISVFLGLRTVGLAKDIAKTGLQSDSAPITPVKAGSAA